MVSMAPQKKIQYLRRKNKILLEKLECQSSEIEFALRALKRTLRGRGIVSKSPSSEAKQKAWTRRNDSTQVTQAISHDAINHNEVHHGTQSSFPLECMQGFSRGDCEGKDFEPDEREPDSCKRVNFKRKCGEGSKFKHSKPCHDRPTVIDSISKKSQAIREIVSLIDYSPKSTFLRKMKSKCQPYVQEKAKRGASDEMDCDTQCHDERERTPSIKHARCGRNTEGPSETSVCKFCEKVERRTSHECLEEENLDQLKRVKREDKKLDRLKKFREENWMDCHASPCKCDSCHCSGQHNCGSKVYGVNDRLFPVPMEHTCEKLLCCPHCKRKKCGQTCCGNSKQVIVAIPTSCMDGTNDFAFSKEACKSKHQRSEGDIQISSGLVEKLQKRPKPENSMALRYQKGVC